RPVDLLDLLDQVELHGAGAEDAQHLVRVDGARDELLADVDVLALLDQETRPHRHRVGDLVGAVVGDDDDLPRLLRLVDLDGAGDLADRGHALGDAGLEQLLDARQTVRDVAAGHTTGVEGAHRQLRARLTDGLRGDDADGLTDVHPLAGGQRTAVAGGADTDLGLADQGAAGADPLHAGLDQALHDRFGQVGVGREDDRPVDDDVLGDRAADQAGLRGGRLDQRAVRQPLGDVERDRPVGAAVGLADDDVLSDVHQAPGQVTRVGGAQRGVGQALAGAVRRDEVLDDRQALAERRLDRTRDGLALGVGDQAAHAGDLAELERVPAGARLDHHPDRVVLRDRLLHVGRDVRRGLVPDLDELLLALVVGDQAAVELPLHLLRALLVAAEDLRLVR